MKVVDVLRSIYCCVLVVLGACSAHTPVNTSGIPPASVYQKHRVLTHFQKPGEPFILRDLADPLTGKIPHLPIGTRVYMGDAFSVFVGSHDYVFEPPATYSYAPAGAIVVISGKERTLFPATARIDRSVTTYAIVYPHQVVPRSLQTRTPVYVAR